MSDNREHELYIDNDGSNEPGHRQLEWQGRA